MASAAVACLSKSRSEAISITLGSGVKAGVLFMEPTSFPSLSRMAILGAN